MRGRSEYKRIWKFLGVLVGICLLLLVFLIVFSGSSRLETITVEGNTYYTDQEIIDRVVTEPTDQFTLLLYLRCRYREIERIPFVEYVDVKMEDKNTAVLTVYEKIITGCVRIMGSYLYFDKDGIVVESSSEKREEIPIVTGLDFDSLVLYEELKVQNEELFTTILNLTRLIDKYELDVDEISFNSALEVDFVCGDIRVKLGKKEMYDEPVAALVNILPEADKLGKKMVIDMTDYKPGERIIGTYEE
ncbi:MAG: cell division protein FtsQ/DivIB [Lachnospiraceae bacterium]|nr:cell division protein FtsQ/DivIB [Lachnospiraceae bacterium]